ncbi:MAG TPA: putative DNA-binding protein [Pseudogracilibacillus sp.]|nr:putative DNA-binding protein [Pseudogracilibacillus sp.]
MLEKTTRINMLYDFYGQLLTNKQKEYMELYYREDYSLGEIANEIDVSRQAVYDTIKRTEQLLETYERKLKLYEKFIKRKELFIRLKQECKHIPFPDTVLQIIKDIQKLD